MIKKGLIIAGFALLFSAVVAIFILRGIDGESVRPKLEAAFKENTGADLKMKSLELSLPFSGTLNDVELTTADQKVKLRFDSLEIRPVYWRLVFLTPTVRLLAGSKDGWMQTEVATGVLSGKTRISLKAQRFPIDKALVLLGGSELPIGAEISAEADFTAPRNLPADSSGNASFTMENIGLKSGSVWASLLSGLAPKSAKCSLEIRDRELHTKKCSASTTMGSAELRVASKILDEISNSSLNGAVVVNPKGSMAEALSLLYLRYRKPDGAYYIPVSGTLANPKFGL